MTIKKTWKSGEFTGGGLTYRVGFKWPDGGEDETEFEDVKDLDDLENDFRLFSIETGVREDSVTYIEEVSEEERMKEIREYKAIEQQKKEWEEKEQFKELVVDAIPAIQNIAEAMKRAGYPEDRLCSLCISANGYINLHVHDTKLEANRVNADADIVIVKEYREVLKLDSKE